MNIKKQLYVQAGMLLICIFILFPASCLSNNEKTEYETNQKFIYMYDNCPNETSAKLALSAIKSSNKGYKGVTKYNIADTPAEDNIENVTQYYGYCKNIKTAITKGSKRLCNLTFNTEKDGSGIMLDLSTKESRIESLIKMVAYGKTTIYAIYSY
ncbi:MAG: hypothetical protein IJ828_00220 [Treponema sp.]|nr:hypothetical protein [Treponema sp.]